VGFERPGQVSDIPHLRVVDHAPQDVALEVVQFRHRLAARREGGHDERPDHGHGVEQASLVEPVAERRDGPLLDLGGKQGDGMGGIARRFAAGAGEVFIAFDVACDEFGKGSIRAASGSILANSQAAMQRAAGKSSSARIRRRGSASPNSPRAKAMEARTHPDGSSRLASSGTDSAAIVGKQASTQAAPVRTVKSGSSIRVCRSG
jgi:hypothetical protein